MQIAGLEINGSKISILSLKKQGTRLNVRSFAEIQLPEGTIVNGQLKNTPVLIQILKKIKRQAKPRRISSPYVIITLPEELIYLTVKPFPNIDSDQIREALEINIKDFLPGEPREISWGYQVVEHSQDKEIILASIQNTILKDYLSAFMSAGFSPVAIEPASISALRAFNQIDHTVLAEIDQKSVMITVFDNAASRFSSGFRYEDKSILNHLKKFTNYYKANKNLEKINVIIAGDQATDQMAETLSIGLNNKVSLASEKMVFKNPVIKSPVLLGAAIRGLAGQKNDDNLSLLPVGTAESFEEKKTLRFVGSFINLIIITCILFILIFYGFLGLLYYLNFSTNRQLDNASKIQVEPNVSTAIQEKINLLTPKITYMTEISTKLNPVAPNLEKIKLATPASISLTNITQAKDAKIITITGNAPVQNDLATFKINLEKAGFSKAEISTTNVADKNINFTVSLSL